MLMPPYSGHPSSMACFDIYQALHTLALQREQRGCEGTVLASMESLDTSTRGGCMDNGH
jgi:hypothetical protein